MKILFRIGIYPWAEKDFDKKIKAQRKKYSFAGDRTYSHWFGCKQKYVDYCIGEMIVLFSGSEIMFDCLIMTSKRYDYKFIQDEKQRIESSDLLEEEKVLKISQIDSYSLIPYKPHLFTEKKHYRENIHIDCCHNIHAENMKNDEISNAIINELELINKSEFFKATYFDLEQVKTIASCIDYGKLFKFQ